MSCENVLPRTLTSERNLLIIVQRLLKKKDKITFILTTYVLVFKLQSVIFNFDSVHCNCYNYYINT